MKTKTILILVGLAALVLIFWPAMFLWPTRTKLQTLVSSDDGFEVELFRVDGIDRNYHMNVNGSRVYSSPDFAPRNHLPFRETLFWDKTGDIAVLEIARHRIFGCDVVRKRRLSDDELLAVEPQDDPPLWEYYFESEWPGVGRVRRPE